MPSREEKDAKAARRARKTSDPCSPPAEPSSPSPRRQDRPTKLRGLTKQTYSAYVTAPGSNGPAKKWHLTVSRSWHLNKSGLLTDRVQAYFCSTNYHELPVVTDDPILRTINVPADVYVTGKGLTRKNNTRGVGSSASTPSAPSIKDRPSSTQPFPSHPYPSPRNSFESAFRDDGSRSPWSSSSDAASAMPVTPPQHAAGLPPPGGPSYYYPPPPPLPVGNPYYAAPQPHHPIGNPYVYETAVPVVVDTTPRPPSTLPPLRQSPYAALEEAKPVIVSHPTLPQPTSPPPQQYASYPPPPPPAAAAAPGQYSPPAPAAVGYSTSDVRGESLPGDQSPPRYSARHSLDQRALGAFRLTL